MSQPSDHITVSALSLPHDQRADLALQLLQSLELPGDVVSAEEFGQALRKRVEGYRAGAVESNSLDEARAIIERRLSDQPVSQES